MTLFVSPHGDDSAAGTIEAPFATLARARAAAQPGATVSLRAGTYHLDEPLVLGPEDSGVTYQAHDGEEAVISGGRRITDWNVASTEVLTAEPGWTFRQLYVSGRRAERASVELTEPLSRSETGYSGAPAWQGDVELIYRGVYPWSEARVPGVSDAAGGLTMAQPAFSRALDLYRAVLSWEGPEEKLGMDGPTRAENNPSFLRAGTFALSDGTLHFHRLPGEDASDVVAPFLQSLVRGVGVRDVSFRGITFADSTWLGPSSSDGFLHYHGNGYYLGGKTMIVEFGEGAGSVTVPADSASIPGAIVLCDSDNVTFENCRFTRLGGVALECEGSSVVVADSTFSDIAGGGIVVSQGDNCRLENNDIGYIGLDYRGSPAILLDGTKSAVVAHNEVHDVPHAGIAVYSSTGTQIINNMVCNTMQVLADGGGIYVAGAQGSCPEDAATIRGNIVRDTITPYNFALYTDYGAAWITIEGNVIHHNDNPVALQVFPPLEHVSFIGNYWDADPGEAPDSVTLAHNVVLSEQQFADDVAVAAIVEAAGRTRVR